MKLVESEKTTEAERDVDGGGRGGRWKGGKVDGKID